MITKFYIKPADSKIAVRDPVTLKPLAKDGDWKPQDAFWLRRMRDKDVVETTPPVVTPDGAGSAATDLVKTLLAGTADQVNADLGELSDEALQEALDLEQAEQKRSTVIRALKAAIAARATK